MRDSDGNEWQWRHVGVTWGLTSYESPGGAYMLDTIDGKYIYHYVTPDGRTGYGLVDSEKEAVATCHLALELEGNPRWMVDYIDARMVGGDDDDDL